MRHRIASTLLPCLLALTATASLAQEEAPLVPPAPPAMRDFQLKPDIDTTPVPTTEQPAIQVPRVDVVPPAAATIPPAVQPAETAPAPAPTEEAPPPVPRTDRREQRAPAAVPEPAPQPERTEPADSNADAEAAPPPAATPVPAPVLAEPPAPVEDGFPWLWLGAAALALIAAVAWLARRRRVEEVESVPTEAAPAEPEPAPAPPVATPPAPRPRLTLEFKPLMVGSTDDQAAVQFELMVRNVGNAVAQNVRIAIRMINASARQNEELAAFFREPIATVDHRPLTIPPGGRAETRRTAVLPKDAVQAISFQGRSLFIPVLAFNAVYEWGDGQQGQTATSFVVGRETNPPAEKMAPFRLDLGPRIYRTVGQRRNELELVA